MTAVPLGTNEAVEAALGLLADLERLRGCEQPLLASAANRAHAALARALAGLAPDAFNALP